MAATHGGANYFLLQARIVAEQANVDAANTTLETPITRWSRAPYRGMKQTTCAIKYLKAKSHRHAQDLKKVERSLSETRPTSKIGVQNHVAQQHPIQLIEGDTMPKPATLKFNTTLMLPTITEEVPEQKASRIKIHFKNSAPGLPTPPNSATTENNSISKRCRLRFRLNPEDRLPKSFMDEWKHRLMTKHAAWATLDPMDIDTNNDTDTDTETNNNKSPEKALKATMLNNKHYGSTRIFHISNIPKKMTAEEKKKAKNDENSTLGPERLRLKEHREKKAVTRNLVIYNTNCDYFKALRNEEKNPTMVPSQLQPIFERVQQFQSKGPALHDRYDEKISKKAVVAFARAEKIIEDRSKVANLIRVNKEKEVKGEHVLSAIPLHMRLHETYNGTRAMGRIECGIERIWGIQASSSLGRSV